ncbi:MAG: hypothetical protein JO202_15830 [Ktedonobacteraceae bacterium]|nr:hypothetical protein [Ktedonobacteraceae bacterium]
MPYKQLDTRAMSQFTMDELLTQVAEVKNGRPNWGAILHYFRQQMGWKAWELGLLYGEALQDEELEQEPKTASWIYMMESQNMVPWDEKRRWILATLLDIPPVLFGLQAGHNAAPAGEEPASALSTLLSWERVDIAEYRATLARLCATYHSETLSLALMDIKRRMQSLHTDLAFRTAPDKEALQRLLCEYYLLAARIAHDQGASEIAIGLLSRVIMLAEHESLFDLHAYALRERAICHSGIGFIKALEGRTKAAQEQYAAAARDALASRSLAAKIPPLWRGIVLLSAGATIAGIARDHNELLEALRVIDQGAKEIGKHTQDKRIPTVLDEELYLSIRARAYIQSPFKGAYFPASARQALEESAKVAKISSKPRRAEMAVIIAWSYFMEELYPMATEAMEQAIVAVRNCQGTEKYFARLEALYRGLRSSEFGKDAEVARLGVTLLRARRPGLFN